MGWILNKDILVRRVSRAGIKIKIPKSLKFIDKSRLRAIKNHNKYEIVDLADFSRIWVERQNGVWILHASRFDNCQLVDMTYSDYLNKRLACDDNGVFYIQSDNQILEVKKIKLKENARKIIAKKLNNENLILLLLILIYYIKTNDSQVGQFLDKFLTKIQESIPFSRINNRLDNFGDEIFTQFKKLWNKEDIANNLQIGD